MDDKEKQEEKFKRYGDAFIRLIFINITSIAPQSQRSHSFPTAGRSMVPDFSPAALAAGFTGLWFRLRGADQSDAGPSRARVACLRLPLAQPAPASGRPERGTIDS